MKSFPSYIYSGGFLSRSWSYSLELGGGGGGALLQPCSCSFLHLADKSPTLLMLMKAFLCCAIRAVMLIHPLQSKLKASCSCFTVKKLPSSETLFLFKAWLNRSNHTFLFHCSTCSRVQGCTGVCDCRRYIHKQWGSCDTTIVWVCFFLYCGVPVTLRGPELLHWIHCMTHASHMTSHFKCKSGIIRQWQQQCRVVTTAESSQHNAAAGGVRACVSLQTDSFGDARVGWLWNCGTRIWNLEPDV